MIGFFLLNKQKTSYPDFYQSHIIRISYLPRLFLLAYGQTQCRNFLRSYFQFLLQLSALSNICIRYLVEPGILSSVFYLFLLVKVNLLVTKSEKYTTLSRISQWNFFRICSWRSYQNHGFWRNMDNRMV